MKDPRVLSQEELDLLRYRHKGAAHEACTDIQRLLDHIQALHELVNPIQGIFLEREQEAMGWRK